jgi:SAM-dependent methyltransferase
VASPARACPFCGAEATFAFTARDRNREASSERFTYDRCHACGTVFLVDPPGDLSRYYVGDYHGFGADEAPAWQHIRVLQEVERERVELLRRHVSPGALIDVGAGAGGFVFAAREAGFAVTAIEMDERCCRYIEDRLGVRAICSAQPIAELDALPPARVISLWHVLEHLRDPAETIATAARRLEPGGVLALGVPNPRSLQFRVLRGGWHHLDTPRHLSLVPAAAIVEHGRALGLRCVELTTNDAFGRLCNLNGWIYALRRHPARTPPGAPVLAAGKALTTLAAPLERSDGRGAALTILLEKPAEPVVSAGG